MNNGNHTPARINEGAYYPSKDMLSEMVKQFQAPVTRRAIRPGFIARTDGFDIDQTVKDLEAIPGQEALLSRLLSVSDLTEKVYNRFAENPNSLYNWFPVVMQAPLKSNTKLKTQKTKTMRLPIEMAQFIRLEYPDTSQADKDLFNNFIFDQFELEDDKTYFIKTGTFSSRFQFANAKCRSLVKWVNTLRSLTISL